ncbi:hypothetical protein VB773_15325 [Haloarculaceae archaeon H-GB2-1]|nr:hypothetical protein [Haloarculaceae archaeon H-GB1-1]MEA5387331.1 hypothetical protein [Haloarculaceae archaeon H-GB11]MEA5408799.1 hypothetical protein [Haloarculaceae archaeon H-GB2-1]
MSDTDSPQTAASTPESDNETASTTMTYIQWAAFGILALLALVATFRFYMAASRAISIWISSDFEPIFQAIFNLAILAAAALGLSILARRLTE